MSQRLLMLTAIIALMLRLVNAWFLPWQGGELVISDMKGYDRAAIALLEQRPLAVHTAEKYLFHPLGSDTYHPPGYYFFLAGIYAVLGHSYLAVRIVQAFLGTLTCLLIYLLTRQIFGELPSLLAAGFSAIYPPLVFYTGVLLTESLSTFLLAAGTWLLVSCVGTVQRRRYACLIAAGLLLGLAALSRSVLLAAVPFVLVWLLFIAERRPSRNLAVRYALALCLPIVLVIAPITLRNYQIHRQLVLISTNGGVNFFLGHGGNPTWKDQIRNIPQDYQEGHPLIGISSRTATQEEAYFYQLGWEYIRQHPVRTLRTLPGKFRQMYWDSDYWPASDDQASILRAIDRILWNLLVLPLFVLALLFLTVQTRRGTGAQSGMPRLDRTKASQAALLYGIALSSAVIPAMFWAQTRFRIPFVPYFIAAAAGAACEIYRWLTQGGSSTIRGIRI